MEQWLTLASAQDNDFVSTACTLTRGQNNLANDKRERFPASLRRRDVDVGWKLHGKAVRRVVNRPFVTLRVNTA